LGNKRNTELTTESATSTKGKPKKECHWENDAGTGSFAHERVERSTRLGGESKGREEKKKKLLKANNPLGAERRSITRNNRDQALKRIPQTSGSALRSAEST